jgi:hypothetical protein
MDVMNNVFIFINKYISLANVRINFIIKLNNASNIKIKNHLFI